MRIEIDGLGIFEVDEGFARLPPALQQQRVEEIKRAATGGMKSGFAGAAPKARVASVVQGLTLGFGDEIAGAVRSAMPGGGTYAEEVAKSRDKLKAYQQANPIASTLWEAGGAVLPAIGGLLTGGAGTAAAGGRLAAAAGRAGGLRRAATVGAAEGAVHGAGTGEGMQDRLGRIAPSAAFGAAGGVIGQQAVKPLEWLLAGAKRLGGRSANAVLNEIQRLAGDTGLTIDEAVARVANGEILGEMSHTLRAALRAAYTHAGPGRGAVVDTLRTRSRDNRRAAMGDLQRELSPGGDPNVLRGQLDKMSEGKAQAKKDYAAAYATSPQAGFGVLQQLATALTRDPQAAREAARLVKLRTGREPYFTVLDDGRVQFGGLPTTEEAEIIRRSLYGQAGKAYQSGDGEIGEAIGSLEKGVRGALDRQNPALGDTRAKYAGFKAANEAFKAGETALSGSADQAAIAWRTASEAGPEAQAAFRAGLMSSLRARAGGGQSGGLMSQLMDQDRNMGQVLRMVLTPEQQAALLRDPAEGGLLGSIGRAEQSVLTERKVLGGSDTAESLAQAKRQGAAGMISDVAGAARGNPMALLSIASRVAEAQLAKLNDRQRQQVLELLLAEDPAKVARALADGTGTQLVNELIERVKLAGMMGGGVVGANVNEPSR